MNVSAGTLQLQMRQQLNCHTSQACSGKLASLNKVGWHLWQSNLI